MGAVAGWNASPTPDDVRGRSAHGGRPDEWQLHGIDRASTQAPDARQGDGVTEPLRQRPMRIYEPHTGCRVVHWPNMHEAEAAHDADAAADVAANEDRPGRQQDQSERGGAEHGANTTGFRVHPCIIP